MPDASAQLAHWVKAGKILPADTEDLRFEWAPDAMIGLLRGENIGKMVVTIPER